MKMISHQTIGAYLNGKDLGKLAELVYEQLAVTFPLKYVLSPVTAVYDMIACSRIFHSQRVIGVTPKCNFGFWTEASEVGGGRSAPR